jgi:hypothetical protein
MTAPRVGVAYEVLRPAFRLRTESGALQNNRRERSFVWLDSASCPAAHGSLSAFEFVRTTLEARVITPGTIRSRHLQVSKRWPGPEALLSRDAASYGNSRGGTGSQTVLTAKGRSVHGVMPIMASLLLRCNVHQARSARCGSASESASCATERTTAERWEGRWPSGDSSDSVLWLLAGISWQPPAWAPDSQRAEAERTRAATAHRRRAHVRLLPPAAHPRQPICGAARLLATSAQFRTLYTSSPMPGRAPLAWQKKFQHQSSWSHGATAHKST